MLIEKFYEKIILLELIIDFVTYTEKKKGG